MSRRGPAIKRTLAAASVLLLVLAAWLVLHVSSRSYSSQDRTAPMAGATAQHWAGTDPLGRDRMVRISAALLLGVVGAGIAAALTTALAASVGMLAAFSHPALAAILMLLSDLFLTLPWLFLLMMVRAGQPLTTSPMHSAVVTFALLAALGWPACARAVYQGAITLRHSEWILHGRAGGLRPGQIARLHVLPHLRPLLLPQFLICIPTFIVAEANLGTLGLGVAEPLPSWGAMLMEMNHTALFAHSVWVYLPLALLVLTLVLLEAVAGEA